jgi:transposase
MTRWTTPTLAEHLRCETGTDVHPETVRGALGRLGFSWKRPRRQLPQDPDYEERMAEVERAIEEAGPGGAVLFEDETELRRFPPLRSAWMPYGEQRSVEVPKQNGKFALYGALDIESGRVVTEPHEKGRSDYTKSFLATLLRQVEGEILMVWDRASWHTSNAVEEWIAEHDSLEVVLLPKRALEDNSVEDLWRRLKNVISANLERGLDVLKDACREFFDALSPRQALCTAGLAQN